MTICLYTKTNDQAENGEGIPGKPGNGFTKGLILQKLHGQVRPGNSSTLSQLRDQSRKKNPDHTIGQVEGQSFKAEYRCPMVRCRDRISHP